MKTRFGQPPYPTFTAYLKLHNLAVTPGLLRPLEQYARYAMLAEGPGSMALYLATMLPAAAHGMGITRYTGNSAWDWHPAVRALQPPGRFRLVDDAIGDLCAHPDAILADMGPGQFDLVVADGGLAAPEGRKETLEALAAPLLQAELWLGTRLLRDGGDMVFKIYNTMSPLSVGMLHNVAACFDAVTITHGALVRPNNQERYVVARGRRAAYLAVAVDAAGVDGGAEPAPVDAAFLRALSLQNNATLRLQIAAHSLEALAEAGLGTAEDLQFDPLPGAVAAVTMIA